jgi:PAS domain S-box-containing protein
MTEKTDYDLRWQAEEIARVNAAQSAEEAGTLTPETMRQTLHELRVHQIELEMQNEELRRTHLELDASRSRYFDLYDLAPVGYCTVSESGLILEANLNAGDLFGVARSALIKQPFSHFIATADQDIYYHFRKLLFEAGREQWCDLRMVKQNGTSFWTQLAATTAKDDGGTQVMRIVLNDISDRKRVEAERIALGLILKENNSELEYAKIAAEKANQAKSDFLSRMSHELRTPLSAILGFTQLIESGTPPPTQGQMRSIEQVLKAGWYLLDLINEILDLAVIESGRLALLIEPVSLSEILDECKSLVEVQAQKFGVSVVFPLIETPCQVLADRIRIKQVIVNLLSNAIKYNKEGGSVVVECQSDMSRQDTIRINVRDTGIGLSTDQIKNLFQPFNRLGQTADVVEGTGIGLVVCKRLVELMGGTIGVNSTPDQGSVFWFDLKLTSETLKKKGRGPTFADKAPVKDSAKHWTLLYVEDNEANLMLVEEIIARRPDIRLLSATSGMRGIEIARTSHPDVILMDINLPGISGLDALKILKEDKATARIPVLAISANVIPRDIQKALKAGFFRYITKPIMIGDFLKTLDEAFLSPRPSENRSSLR